MSESTSGVFTTQESVLEEISTIYSKEETGILAISQLPSVCKILRRQVFQPQKKVIVLIVGGHSTGKSSFANWFFGDNIQKVSAAIETSKITFITTGRKRESFDGTATLHLFDFLSQYKNIPHFVENLNTEMRLPIKPRSNLVTFVDTPGLIPDKERLPFDCEEIMLNLANHCQKIMVFMDPIGQAFSLPMQEFVAKAHRKFGNRMHFFLTKSDTIDEEERSRIISSISQTLSTTITKRILDVRPIWLPRDGDEEAETPDKSNALSFVCEIIDDAVKSTVQSNCSQLDNDLKDVTRAAEVALKTLSQRKKLFYTVTIAFLGAIGYLLAALFATAMKTDGAKLAVLIGLGAWVIALSVKPSSKEIKMIRQFLRSTARTAKFQIDKFYSELKNVAE